MNICRSLAVAGIVAYLLAPAASLSAPSATQVVEELHATLITGMKKADELGYAGRYEQFAPVVTASFDFPFIARIVVGRYWSSFDDRQKATFVETFTRLSIATYAGRFDHYSGESFKTLSEERLPRNRILVKTVLVKASGEEVHLDYILRQTGDEWRIINVVADGVSDLSLKRADYTCFLKNHDFDALVGKLKEKIDQYSD
ncbi:MAG: ABC transporter substrate-binding protein [Syntrophobacteria bacterium]